MVSSSSSRSIRRMSAIIRREAPCSAILRRAMASSSMTVRMPAPILFTSLDARNSDVSISDRVLSDICCPLAQTALDRFAEFSKKWERSSGMISLAGKLQVFLVTIIDVRPLRIPRALSKGPAIDDAAIYAAFLKTSARKAIHANFLRRHSNVVDRYRAPFTAKRSVHKRHTHYPAHRRPPILPGATKAATRATRPSPHTSTHRRVCRAWSHDHPEYLPTVI